MILPAVISIVLFGTTLVISTGYYLWKISSSNLQKQISKTPYQKVPLPQSIPAQQSIIKPLYLIEELNKDIKDPDESIILQSNIKNTNNYNPNEHQPQDINNENQVNGQGVEGIEEKNKIEQRIHDSNIFSQLIDKKLPLIINPKNQGQEQTVEPNENDGQQTTLNSIVLTNQSDGIIELEEKKFKRLLNIHLLISCLVFGQAIIGRIFVLTLDCKIHLGGYFYLSALNTCIALVLYHLCYGFLIISLRQLNSNITLLKFALCIYGLAMSFPLYFGVGDEVQNDFLIVLISIGYMTILQALLTFSKVVQRMNEVTELSFI